MPSPSLSASAMSRDRGRTAREAVAAMPSREAEARTALLQAIALIDKGKPMDAKVQAELAASWLEGCRSDERIAAAVRSLRGVDDGA